MGRTATLAGYLDILGVRLSLLDSYRHAVETIVERIGCGEKTFCVAVNPEKIYRAQSDTELRDLLNQADLQICDGVGAAFASRVLHGRRVARITGIQLFLDMVGAAEKYERSVFLLGASEASSAGAAECLQRKHRGLKIVGRQNGYFSCDAEVVDQINRSGADMLFVAMGSPRQERWIAAHRHEIGAPFCMGVGGTLDVVSGRVARAPAICRKTGTEFLYRLLREPWRWRRQLCLPLFLLSVFRHVLLGRTWGKGSRETEPISTPNVTVVEPERRKAA